MRAALGPVADFPVGECRIMQVDGVSVGVFHLSDGTLRAVRNVCPHHGAPVCRGTLGGTLVPSAPGRYELGLQERVLRCPWHGWEFDLESGRALFGVGIGARRARLRTYWASVEDGQVVVDTDRAGAPSGA